MGCCGSSGKGKAARAFARMQMLPSATGQLTRMAPRGQLGSPIKGTILEPESPWYRPPFVEVQPRQPFILPVDPPPGSVATVRAAGAPGLHLRPSANRNAFSIIPLPNRTRVTVLRTSLTEDYAAAGALARWWEVEAFGRRGFVQAKGDDGNWNFTWPGSPHQGAPFVPPRITPGQPW